jgi:hypothetical protein
MTVGSPRSDQSRSRVALVFLVAGVMLLLWSWGSWVYRTSASARRDAVAIAPDDLEASVPVGAGTAFRQWLAAGAVLAAAMAAGGYVLTRSGGRSSGAAVRDGTVVPSTDDAWLKGWQTPRGGDLEQDRDET